MNTAAPAAGRAELDVAELAAGEAYRTLTACFIPRPIAWVSSISATGTANLAPHSFTTVAGIDPITVCFTSTTEKDSLRNIRETGEFVLNIGAEAQAAVMNDCATDFDAAVSEFDAAAVPTEPSAVVAPPRVRDAPVALECRAAGEHVIGSSVMTFGTVLRIAVRHDVLAADGLPDPALLAPLARLGRNQWARLGEVFALDRLRADQWADGARTPVPEFHGPAG